MSVLGNDFNLLPGMSAVRETAETNVLWNKGSHLIHDFGSVIDGSARDSGNTTTTILRGGLLLGKVTSTGKLKEYSGTATDGTQTPYGLCPYPLKMQDFDAANVDRNLSVIIGGFVKAAEIHGLDERARRHMRSRGFVFDDELGLPRGLVYVNTAASAAHTNTTTEALFDKTYTIPANALKAGTVFKVRYQGIATATNSTDTLTVKLYLGGLSGTALLTGTATDVADNHIFAGEFTGIVRTAGSSGTFVGYGTHTDVPAASGTAAHDITEITASTTIDTTATQVIGVGADWSVANAGNSARLDLLVVEIY